MSTSVSIKLDGVGEGEEKVGRGTRKRANCSAFSAVNGNSSCRMRFWIAQASWSVMLARDSRVEYLWYLALMLRRRWKRRDRVRAR
jgi:hypothetical protein